jgi:ribosomal protein L29
MKHKDIKTLHQKSKIELEKDLETKQHELGELWLRKNDRKEKNTRKSRGLRDDIARINTIIKELNIKGK